MDRPYRTRCGRNSSKRVSEPSRHVPQRNFPPENGRLWVVTSRWMPRYGRRNRSHTHRTKRPSIVRTPSVTCGGQRIGDGPRPGGTWTAPPGAVALGAGSERWQRSLPFGALCLIRLARRVARMKNMAIPPHSSRTTLPAQCPPQSPCGLIRPPRPRLSQLLPSGKTRFLSSAATHRAVHARHDSGTRWDLRSTGRAVPLRALTPCGTVTPWSLGRGCAPPVRRGAATSRGRCLACWPHQPAISTFPLASGGALAAGCAPPTR